MELFNLPFTDGNVTGYGTLIFPTGERYVGYLQRGVAHGQGAMYHPDGLSVEFGLEVS